MTDLDYGYVSAEDIADFRGYLRCLTDRQVLGVLEKERDAGREVYAELAHAELELRERRMRK